MDIRPICCQAALESVIQNCYFCRRLGVLSVLFRVLGLCPQSLHSHSCGRTDYTAFDLFLLEMMSGIRLFIPSLNYPAGSLLNFGNYWNFMSLLRWNLSIENFIGTTRN